MEAWYTHVFADKIGFHCFYLRMMLRLGDAPNKRLLEGSCQYCICQSRDCNLVESQILLVETPIGSDRAGVPDWDFYL